MRRMSPSTVEPVVLNALAVNAGRGWAKLPLCSPWGVNEVIAPSAIAFWHRLADKPIHRTRQPAWAVLVGPTPGRMIKFPVGFTN